MGIARADAVYFPPTTSPPLMRPRQRCGMGKVTGFLEIEREQPARRKVEDRLQDWFEIYEPFPRRTSAGRAPAAWTAASLSATPAVRSTT